MAKKAKLTRLRIYPVKALEGMDANEWELDAYGLRFDRRWMVVDASGQCITRREYPALAAVRAEIEGDRLVLSAPHQPPLELPTDPEPGPTEPATIGRDTIAVREVSDDASRWLREWLRAACRLVFLPEPRHRSVDPVLGTRKAQLAFQDELPLHLLRAESLDDLNERLGEGVSVEAVRANLVIQGAGTPYDEDTWRRVRIGDVEMQVVKPWPHRIIVRPGGELGGSTGPDAIAELATYRSREGEACFGQLAIADTTVGTLRVGDIVQVLERGEAPTFGADEPAEGSEPETAEEPARESEGRDPEREPDGGRKGGLQSMKVRLTRLPGRRDPKGKEPKEIEAGSDPSEAEDAAPPADAPEEAPPETAGMEEAEPEEAEPEELREEELREEEAEPEELREEEQEPEEPEEVPEEEQEPEEPAVDEALVDEVLEEVLSADEEAEEDDSQSSDVGLEVTTDRVPDLKQTVRLLAAAAVAEGRGETKRLAEACLRSPLLITAWKDDALVGLLRAWTDEVRDGFIADVAVHPDQHGSGAAQELVRHVLSLHPDIRWVLRASPGSAYLGSALGWQHAGSGWYLSPR